MQQILERFSNQSVLVLGDFMLDEYVHGSVERISPEAPVPVVLEQSVRLVPGGAGNVVRNLRALGARTLVCGIVGNDEAGQSLRRLLSDQGLSAEDGGLVEAIDRPTTRKTRILAGQQQICRLDRESLTPVSAHARRELMDFIERAAAQVQAMIISDYDKGVVTPDIIQYAVECGNRRGCFISVDPQVTHFDSYQQVGVLTPNHHEAGRYLKRSLVEDEAVVAGGWEIMERLQCKMLIITRGEKGMTLFGPQGATARHFPTQARSVFDVTGAGDTVISVFTLAMAAGAAPEEAVRLSNLAAGIVVAQLGAATVSTAQLGAAAAAG
ncbi:MAG: D-glycero-beta-D-manno-heptose-7-phosphate kinase [Leptospirales bacterium]|nr:D-glycero-beta-D-manno-heptose-7-phosphate kinase [Leptospirales bacterium]